MATTWRSIKVELLGGRGQELWPAPGRVFAVGPSHTFTQLGLAIDTAFGRWDLAHLRSFTLQDGTSVIDLESAEELVDSPDVAFGVGSLDVDRVKVLSQVRPGEQFCYVFDLGDQWTHCCTVEEAKVDLGDLFGARPTVPTSYFGWGGLPDQYGRRWEGDHGDHAPPARSRRHPMLAGDWPGARALPPVDLGLLRGAVVRKDVAGIVAAVEGRDVDEALQQVGAAWQLVLESGRPGADGLALSLYNRLITRDAAGDSTLAEDLLAQLKGVPATGVVLDVDLLDLAEELEGDESREAGYLDKRSGEVVPAFLTDEGEVGDAVIDVDEDPDRWLPLERLGSSAGWSDMASFAAQVPDSRTRARLVSAIEGRGAFRRFRDAVSDEGLWGAWQRYAEDRAIGRARDYLADHGILVRSSPRT